MDASRLNRRPGVEKAKGQIREGLRYAWGTRELRVTLLSMAVIGVFAFNFTVSLPLLAKFTFHGGAGLTSVFMAAMGAGAVVGGLFTAFRSRPSTRLLACIGVLFGASILAVAVAPTVLAATALLVVMGAGAISFVATNNATLQLRSDPAMRGRVMSLNAIAFLGSTPIGAPLIGVISDATEPAGGARPGWSGDASGQRAPLRAEQAARGRTGVDLIARTGRSVPAPDPRTATQGFRPSSVTVRLVPGDDGPRRRRSRAMTPASQWSLPVRIATPEDAAAVASVHVESWRAAYRGQLPDQLLDTLSVDRRAEAWRDVIGATGASDAVLLLERAGLVEGFAHVCAARDSDVGRGVGEVSAIYLRPSSWGQGSGRLLMAAALSHLAAAGWTSAVLWVLAANERARRFYEAGGWAHDGTERTESIGGARAGRDPLPAGHRNGARARPLTAAAATAPGESARTLYAALGSLGSLGRPRARSPTMLRWISAAPPQIVSDREKKYDDWMSSTG